MKNDDQVATEVKSIDELAVYDLFPIIYRKKYLIIFFSFLFGLTAFVYSLSLPNLYRSETTLISVAEKKEGGNLSQLSSLASMAGISLGSGNSSGVDKTTIALEVLKSRTFIIAFLNKHNIKPYLCAIKNWETLEKPIWDEEFYNVTSNTFIDQNKVPPDEKFYRNFLSLLEINQDLKTKVIRISLVYPSPKFASEWLHDLIVDLNEHMRQKDLAESKRSIAFLEDQISKTNIAEIKNVLFALVEDTTKTLMLVNIRQEYIFSFIDSPNTPIDKFAPNRKQISIVGCIVGFVLSAIGFIFFDFYKKRPN